MKDKNNNKNIKEFVLKFFKLWIRYLIYNIIGLAIYSLIIILVLRQFEYEIRIGETETIMMVVGMVTIVVFLIINFVSFAMTVSGKDVDLIGKIFRPNKQITKEE